MIRALLLLIALAFPATAETARVLSGEHADFTRLVVELPKAEGWRVGRTAMGYAFAAAGAPQPDYDLSGVWDRIPRTRLQAVRVDPGSGALILTLACACHILPFEYRPGTVVLDIRSGPAPKGSAFEVPFALAAAPEDSVAPASEAPLVYDWRAVLPGAPRADVDLLPLASADASLAPLRDALLAGISRGAVEGLVDMQLPAAEDSPAATPTGAPDQMRISLGPLPGLVLDLGEPEEIPVLTCLPDSDLALPDWGDGRPVLELLSEARSGLYGEFDALVSAEVLQAVRLHLYLGFGAEARQYAQLLPKGDQPAVLLSMARLVEGEDDPATPFAGMLGCDGAAALWAALAHRSLPAEAKVNVDAIVRSFVALPAHLRRHLGPGLVELLLPKDAAAARMIRDAMARTPDMAPGQIALADARAELAAGRPEEALSNAEQALSEGLPAAQGMIALVEAHLRAMKPMAPDQAEAVLALQKDAGAGVEGERARRAAVLALALSGQADRAFALAGASGPEHPDLWRVTLALADDSAFLIQAIPAAPRPDVDTALAMEIAGRLLSLGFPDAALAWLGPVEAARPDSWRLLAARAELGRGDPRQALTLVTGLAGEEALDLRRRAEVGLGALEAAQRSAAAGGRAEEAARLAAWRSDWGALAGTGVSPWAEAASHARPEPNTTGGPLARGAALLDSSAETRAAVEALLVSVKPLDP